jgi:hypothetical protein
MKLNETTVTYVEVNKKHVHVEYCFTKNTKKGDVAPDKKLWAMISFIHPETRQKERLRVTEPQDILKSTEEEIHEFVEKEVECFLKHCREYN